MAVKQTVTLINNTPNITQKQHIHKVSTKIISTKHAPEGTNPKTMEEFMKVAKQYWEFGVDIKERRGPVYDVYPYRCLFSTQKLAEEARQQIEQIMIDRNLKIAQEEYKKSKWKEEAEKWGEEYNENEGDIND